MHHYNALNEADYKRMQARKKSRNKDKLVKLAAERENVMANIKSMQEHDTIERDMIIREHAQMLVDYAEYGHDYVIKNYHGGFALANLLEGLQSSSKEERAYWSKLALEHMDKAEMRKLRRMLEENPGEKIIKDITPVDEEILKEYMQNR